MKDDVQWQNYLIDLGRLVKEYALTAAEEREKHRNESTQKFYDGYVLGFHRIVSLMHQQALDHNIDLKEMQLYSIEPDCDLV
jgi:hypothetical protein